MIRTTGVIERECADPARCEGCENLGGRGGDFAAPGGRSDLILDDFQLFALRCKPQNRKKKIPTARGIDPGGTKNQMRNAGIANRLFALPVSFCHKR